MMYLVFVRGLIIVVVVLGQEVFSRPVTGRFRFISACQAGTCVVAMYHIWY